MAIGLALVVAGIVMDLMIAFYQPPGVSTLGLMAIAQTAIIAGANVGLVGAMASLLEGE